MKTYRNEITVRRNESFTIDRFIVNRDGSPYVISSELHNPWFLITVASTNYNQKERYVKNYWLSTEEIPKFLITQIEEKTTDWNALPYPNDNTYDRVYHHKGEYKYYTNKSNEGITWNDYDCRIVKTFTPEDTSEWVEQSYQYSIRLVSGEFNANEPPVKIDYFVDILEPTKLTVLSDLYGGFNE